MDYKLIQNGGDISSSSSSSSSIWASEWLYLLLILGIVMGFFKICYPELEKLRNQSKEGFQDKQKQQPFTFLQGDEMYHDQFYVDIYDQLVYNDGKNDYEIKELTHIFKQQFSEGGEYDEIRLLDCGCGTGHHVNAFQQIGFGNVTGVDISKQMVTAANKYFPKSNFMVGDVLQSQLFPPKEFTHITCFYFTIYYIRDKEQFAENCYHWLEPNGILVVHIVNRDKFDPVIPPANPFLIVNPQSYAKKRITKSSVVFNDFIYTASFDVKNKRESYFEEKFQSKQDKTTFRKQRHIMYMEDEAAVVQVFENSGFLMVGKVDLMKVAYDYQFLYVFRKPF